MQKPDVTVILPTYNESGNIERLITEIDAAFKGQICQLVVDDHSPDETYKLVEGLFDRFPHLKLIHRVGRRGLTSAIQEGIESSDTKYVGWMDCDLSMPPKDLYRLYKAALQGADLAVGSRYVPGGEDARQEMLAVMLSKTISFICRNLLDRRFRDYTSGFIIAKRNALRGMRLKGDYGEYFIDLIYQALERGLQVKELPYRLISRTEGVSKTATHPLGFAIRGRKYLWTVTRLLSRRAGLSPERAQGV